MNEQKWKEFAGESESSQSSLNALALDLKALFALITWAAISTSLWSVLTFTGHFLLSIYLIVFSLERRIRVELRWCCSRSFICLTCGCSGTSATILGMTTVGSGSG